MPAGRYMLLVFDGSEGGTHFTWDYIRVVADDSAEASGSSWLLPTVLAAAVLLGVALVFRLRARTSRPTSADTRRP